VDAHGLPLTSMMGVRILRMCRPIDHVAVTQETLREIAKLYAVDPAKLNRPYTFMSFMVQIDDKLPALEIHFCDRENNTVAKIVNLGKSRPIPIEELTKKNA
jgi:hypothetical protein